MRRIYLIDNSVLQRLPRSAEVRAARDALIESGELATCLPSLLEAGYSARSADEHGHQIDGFLAGWVILPPVPEVMDLALGLQRSLFAAGKGRSVAVSDLQIAATALHYGTGGDTVIIKHYDADFDHLASVNRSLLVSWIIPRGSVS